VDAGQSPQEAATRFAVGLSTVRRYLRRRRDTGNGAPSLIPGRPRTIPPDEHPALAQQVATHPDAYLDQHCQLWEARTGTRVSSATMSRALARLCWTRKKSP